MKDSIRKIILEFLQTRPRGKAAVPFVRLCLAIVQYHLIHRLKAGHRLPQDLTNPDRSIEGLANDVVGFFLSEKDEPPYPWIFDYLAVRGFTCFTEAQMPEIERLLGSLIWDFADKRVFKIGREENPELGKTTKAIEAALRLLAAKGEILMIEIDNGRRTLVRSATTRDLRTSLEMMPLQDLLLLVAESYACTRNKVELCRQAVKMIFEQDRFARQFYKHEFLEAAKSIVSMHAQYGAPRLASIPGPIQELLRQEIEKERLSTVEHITKPLVEEQHRKGRITAAEVPQLLIAVDRYELDRCYSAFDGLPTYFREALPDIPRESYREDYKYAFETVTGRSWEALLERIRNNPTIQKLRYYL